MRKLGFSPGPEIPVGDPCPKTPHTRFQSLDVINYYIGIVYTTRVRLAVCAKDVTDQDTDKDMRLGSVYDRSQSLTPLCRAAPHLRRAAPHLPQSLTPADHPQSFPKPGFSSFCRILWLVFLSDQISTKYKQYCRSGSGSLPHKLKMAILVVLFDNLSRYIL